MSWLVAFLIGTAAGVLSGAGIGGGTLLVLYLTALAGTDQIAAQGINLLYFIACAPPALVSHIKNHLIDFKPSIVASLCGCAAAVGGVFLAGAFSGDTLRKIFGVLFIIVGIKELFFNQKGNEKN